MRRRAEGNLGWSPKPPDRPSNWLLNPIKGGASECRIG